MPAIMADNNVEGQLDILLDIFHEPTWREIWISLNLPLETFESLKLPRETKDSTLWNICQQREIILITGNRNRHDADSLDATIHASNTPDSLPVITIANPKQIVRSKAYAKKAADRLIEYLFDLEAYRGAGRLFVP